MSQLTKEEKETIIIFNEQDALASVFTYNKAMRRRLDKICAERTEAVQRRNEEECAEYTIPKKWIKINPTKIRNMTDEQRQALAERMRKLRQK